MRDIRRNGMLCVKFFAIVETQAKNKPHLTSSGTIGTRGRVDSASSVVENQRFGKMLVNRAGHPRLAEISSERRQIVRSWWEMLAADPSWKREVYNSPSLSMCCVCSRRYGKPSKRLLDPEQNVAHAMMRGQGISAQSQLRPRWKCQSPCTIGKALSLFNITTDHPCSVYRGTATTRVRFRDGNA